MQRVSTLKLKLSQATTSSNTLADAINGSYVTAMQNVPATIDRTSQTVQSAVSALASKPADIQSAQNSVDSAQISVQTAQTNLDYAILRAPSAGVIQAINGTVGEPASTSTTTPVVLLANTGTVQLHGTVGESEVSKLKLGLVANITVDALGASTRMTGKVTGVDPVATIQQGVPVYGVDVTIDVPNASIKPGMSGTASVAPALLPPAGWPVGQAVRRLVYGVGIAQQEVHAAAGQGIACRARALVVAEVNVLRDLLR